ncbi:ABC1 kinase family protein [Candidatus Laterigemmans baculatus]|uniref:ABC1 kinase family protein n=1 Tax=Candidatus Laterigemmans baculatus TaxID=2770505 RepID=UPI0013DAB6F3|nr:AarF/UbiB family protein [Candidatus Laterigemmans baculatus]
MLSLRPKYLKRYRDVVRLLVRYGRSDLVKQAGLAEAIGEAEVPAVRLAEAEELAGDLERLGPTFIKLGQLLSTRPDVLPPSYLDALARLQNRVEPFSFAEVERTVTSELGVRLSRGFGSFDRKPLASASLSQVHRATLRDGRQVVVKVQRPGIRDQVIDDLDALEDLAGIIDHHTSLGRRYDFGGLLEALRHTLLRELDFRNEAQNLLTMQHNLRKFRQLRVPAPIEDYTSRRVLTMEYVSGITITDGKLLDLFQLERQSLCEELYRAYLHQVLVDGFFHADPHPGNLSLTPDRRIVVFDLGMVVRIPPRLQDNLIKLLLAISEGRGEDAAAVATKIGQKDPDFDKAEFQHRIVQLVTDNQNTSLEQMQLGHVVLEIRAAAAETGIRLPQELTMLSKTLLNLEKTLRVLDPRYDVHDAIRRYTSEILHRRAQGKMSLQGLYSSLIEVNEFATLLPERANKILDLLAENELRMKVDAVDEAQLIQGIQKIANRITMGLILAALIVGAALMMDVPTDLRLFGYPAIAMFFFLAAAAGGLMLVFQIVVRDRHDG